MHFALYFLYFLIHWLINKTILQI